ncbi:unnamed protein product [Ilex paraguariensis]|uniref:Uncharacterized protein n=1 Tax=Ilex paraguariensis TaxID=185542 RepID=A0ABC8RJT5_9AQUA
MVREGGNSSRNFVEHVVFEVGVGTGMAARVEASETEKGESRVGDDDKEIPEGRWRAGGLPVVLRLGKGR